MLDNIRIRRFYAALGAANLRNAKEDLLSGFGVESTKDLTPAQADELTNRLNQIAGSRKKEVDPELRKQRSIAMTIINELGIYATKGDWTRVNRFLLKPQIAGKLLYEHNLDELKKLQKKLRKIARDKQKKAQEEKFQATNN